MKENKRKEGNERQEFGNIYATQQQCTACVYHEFVV
jgi:hypothetical protein